MVLVNGTARQTGRHTPFTVQQLNAVRAQLLQDPFFDRNHQPEELKPRISPSVIQYDDLVLLLAKLNWALKRQGPLAAIENVARVTVRNEVLNQPFFDRGQPASLRPFRSNTFDDEGYSG